MTRRAAVRMRRPRGGRRSEAGFTLIELLVSVTILGIIGVAIGASFDAGIKAIGTGGAGDRVAGAHDVGLFEQNLGVDLTRASCLYVASTTTSYGSGTSGSGCTRALPGPAASACGSAGAPSPCNCTEAGSVICAAWPHIADSTCHLAVYVAQAGPPRTVLRQEWQLSSGSWTPVATVRVNAASVGTPVVSAVPGTAGSGYSWPSSLRFDVTSTAVSFSAPGGTFYFHPLVKNPAAPTGYSLC
jgi:prepilin-type N-terminal cleavage/methylation domain-containing protein